MPHYRVLHAGTASTMEYCDAVGNTLKPETAGAQQRFVMF